MSSHRLITKSLTTGLAAAALAAPLAAARPPLDPTPQLTPQEQQVLASRGQESPQPVQVPAAQTPVARVTHSDGFDWGSAAIGAGGAGVLTLLALGGIGATQRRRVHVGG